MTYEHKIRTVFIFLIFCSIYLVILFNLYTIQIRQRDFFVELGNKQYHVTITTMPARAEIYDRTGQRLAFNHDNLSAFVLPKEIKNRQQLNSFLKNYFPQAYHRLAKFQTTSNNNHFMYIKRKLSSEQLELIKQHNIEDIHLLKEPSRYYPLECTSPIVGITDIDNMGLFGIELMLNAQLAGKPFTHMLNKDARSGHFYFQKETKVEGLEGKPITLTIDSDLQFLAYEELKNTVQTYQAKEGSVLVLNPTTGEILVMANYPCVNPSAFNQESAMDETKNKIVTDAHEPGSVMKVFLALAALEEGVVTSDELIDCENNKIGVIHGFKFSTVHENGVIPFSDVIAHSNNIGVAKVALRLGPTLYDHYKKVGFGKKTALNWPGEQKGYVNPPSKWSRSSLIVLSFGYEITATLLQLATAFGLLANDGYLVQPTLIAQQPVKKSATPAYSTKTVITVRNILEKSIEQGTGKKAKIKGYTVIGKTGTANLVVNGKYAPDQNIFTFTGIVEKDDYKRVIVTFVKNSSCKNMYAATIAAPLFEQIAEKLLIHDKII